MLQTDVRRVRFPFLPAGVRWNENGFDKGVELVQVDVSKDGTHHPSYNVAKKVLEFEFRAEIPRIHLRASYGEGFKGAPLNCEGSLSRDPGELDGQATKKEMHILGGTRHV